MRPVKVVLTKMHQSGDPIEFEIGTFNHGVVIDRSSLIDVATGETVAHQTYDGDWYVPDSQDPADTEKFYETVFVQGT